MAAPRSSPFGLRWIIVVVLAAVVLGGYLGWRHFSSNDAGPTAAAGAYGAGQKAPAIPVTIAPALTADFPVYLNGLGTVEPSDFIH